MITISVSGRKATLSTRELLTQGNIATVSVKFEITDVSLWRGAVLVAVFKAESPIGEFKYKSASVDVNGICSIPKIPMELKNATLKAGLRGTFADGSVITTNLVDCGKTIEGAGGIEFEEAMSDASADSETDFDEFVSELAEMAVGFSHDNQTVLDKLGENNGSITFDGADIPLKSYVDSTFVEKEVGKALSENNYTSVDKSKVDNLKVFNVIGDNIDLFDCHEAGYYVINGTITSGDAPFVGNDAFVMFVTNVTITDENNFSCKQIAFGHAIKSRPIESHSLEGLSSPLRGYTEWTTISIDSLERLKLSGISDGAQVNVVDSITVNGNAQTIVDKSVDVPVSFIVVNDYSDLPAANGNNAVYAYVKNDATNLAITEYAELLFNPNTDDVDMPPMLYDSIERLGGALFFTSSNFDENDENNDVAFYILGIGVNIDRRGLPYITVVASEESGVDRYRFYNRSIEESGGITTEIGWHDANGDLVDTSSEIMTISNYHFNYIYWNGTYYNDVSDLPKDAQAVLHSFSQIVNTPANACKMNAKGWYKQDNNSWVKTIDAPVVPQRESENVIQFNGILRTNRKYAYMTDTSFSLEFPSLVDASIDNTIIFYLAVTENDIDLTFPENTEFYGNIIDTSVGNYTLIIDYNPHNHSWRVGELSSKVN